MMKRKIILSALLLSVSVGSSTISYAATGSEKNSIVSVERASIQTKKYFWTDMYAEGKVFNNQFQNVGLLIDGKLQKTAEVKSDGTFKIPTRGLGLTSADKSFEIVGIYKEGSFGEKTNHKVYPKFNKDYQMTVASYKLGESKIYGTNEAGIDTVALRVNNKVIRKAATVIEANGQETYSLFAKDKVLKKTDRVEIVGYDSSGNTRSVLTVKVNN
ncbi:immunoglobulin-like domain-containing protein [Enterococcus ratti]|uniref:Bacterial Ig domain-containing protein n=1 Tax=Enterococcus ratti TaxID=150033 RepID=A0A1L8WA90_9ENTE|nr:immunoglobulin-like domain-containing protein [Enterococcus ratti]OJG77944.1 hypothetical protein RV14_GL001276 [Enterococcus ratti]